MQVRYRTYTGNFPRMSVDDLVTTQQSPTPQSRLPTDVDAYKI